MVQMWSLFANTSTLNHLNSAIKYLPFNNTNTVKIVEDNLDSETIQSMENQIQYFIDKGVLEFINDYVTISPNVDNYYLAEFLKANWITSINLNKGKTFNGIPLYEMLNNIKNLIDLNNEYLSKIDTDKLLHIVNNRVQTSMFDIIDDPINLVQAQTSVDATTGPLKKKSNESLEAKSLLKATPGNVFNKMEGVVSNQVGRKAIGICATGLKAFFAASHYCNGLIREGKLSESLFNITLNIPTNTGEVVQKTYNTIANLSGLDISKVDQNTPEFKQIEAAFNNDTDAAVILSALLSLATDNAKELALSKLNAGEKTLGLYIFGISIGMEFEDIANIMMSDTALTLTSVMEGNPFNNVPSMSSIKQAINYFNKVDLHKYFDNKTINAITKLDTKKYLTSKLIQNLSIEDLLEYSENLTNSILNSKIDKKDKEKRISLIEFLINYQVQKNSLNQDVLESIRTLRKGAEEFKLLGRLLSLNQGIKTNDEDLHNIIKDFQDLIITASKEKDGLSSDEKNNYKTFKIDLGKFVYDNEYQETIINIYEQVKNTINIPAILAKVPHYNGYLEMLADADRSLKEFYMYRVLPEIIEYGNEELNNKNKKATTKKARFLINDYIRDMWMKDEASKPYMSYTIKKNSVIEGYRFKEDTDIVLGNPESNLLFKHWVEDVVIPDIKRGFDGKHNTNINFINNLFVQDLQPIVFNKTPDENAYINQTQSISMLPNDDYEQAEFDKRRKGFELLCTQNYYNTPLINIFYLYNQIAFNGMVGQASWNKLFEPYKNSAIIKSKYNFTRNLDISKSYKIDIDENIKNLYLAQTGNPYGYGYSKIIRVTDPNTKKKVLAKKKTKKSETVLYDEYEDFNNEVGLEQEYEEDYLDEYEDTYKEFKSEYYELIKNSTLSINNVLRENPNTELIESFNTIEGDFKGNVINQNFEINYNNEKISTKDVKPEVIAKTIVKDGKYITLPNTESLDNIVENKNKKCE